MTDKVHKNMRELFSGWDGTRDNLEDFYEDFRTATEEQAGAWLPGDGNPEDHPYDALFEDVMPSHGEIERRMAQAREAHRMAEEHPERVYHQGIPPTPDMGGITQPACPENLTGPFVPVPPDQVPPPMTGGRKMRIEPYDEFFERLKNEIAGTGDEISMSESAQPRVRASNGRSTSKAPLTRGFPVIKVD